jgi:hypothetical protein
MRLVSRVAICCCLCGTALAEGKSVVQEFIDAVNAFHESLNDAQRSSFQQPFNSEARVTWNFFPGDRVGIALGSLKEDQQARLHEVVQTGLSVAGYAKTESIRGLEEVLGGSYDPGNYYLALFGKPSETAPWALRWEGHHLSLNWTMVAGKVVASTPQFLGANPAIVKDGPQAGTQVLKVEENLARALARSMDEAQGHKAIVSDTAPPEILTRMEREVGTLDTTGITYAELTADQQGMLLGLIEEYARVQRPELAEERLTQVREGGLDTVTFAWMGSLEPGEGHYYRIQGSTFLIEYDNTQNNANHVHTVWRDFDGDFGRDILKEHLDAHRDPETGDHDH